MIGQLRGQVWSARPPTLVLGVQGVGFELDVPISAFVHLPAVNGDVVVYTHQVVREDGSALYGFLSEDERNLFRRLLRINGVGPKLALVLLSSLPPDELTHCVASEDLTRLTRVPGIGRKTAERLLLELRGKLDDFATRSSGGAPTSPPVSVRGEAEAALLALGYAAKDAARLLDGVADAKSLSVAELIRNALRQASRA